MKKNSELKPGLIQKRKFGNNIKKKRRKYEELKKKIDEKKTERRGEILLKFRNLEI